MNTSTTVYTSNITTSNTTGQFSNGELVFQSNGTANVFTGIVLDPHSTILTVNSQANVLYLTNTTIYQQNSTANIASGTVTGVSVNSTSNTISIYISNTVGSFSNTANIVGTTTSNVVVSRSLQKVLISSVIKPYSATGSFIIGESISSNGMTGTIVEAVESTAFINVTSGTISTDTLITGATSGASATVANVTQTLPSNSDYIYQYTKTLSINKPSGTFTAGETVYQKKATANTSNTLLFSNTSYARVVSANTTKIVIDNEIGGIITNQIVYGASSNASAKVLQIKSTTIAKGLIVSNASSNLIVSNVTGSFVSGRHVYNNNNYLANITSITLTSNTIPASNVLTAINNITIKKVSGTPNTSLQLKGNTSSTNCTIVSSTQERY